MEFDDWYRTVQARATHNRNACKNAWDFAQNEEREACATFLQRRNNKMAHIKIGEKFKYLGKEMICIGDQELVGGLGGYYYDCVKAHYINNNGDLKTCVLLPNEWHGIELPNVEVSGRPHLDTTKEN